MLNRTRTLRIFAMLAALLCAGTSWADSHKPRATKADAETVKALKMALKNVTALEIDFTSDKLLVRSIPDGVMIQSGKRGLTIRETKIGPYIHTMKGKLLASGLEAMVIRDVIVSAVFGGTYTGVRDYQTANNDNHPPPCQPCHPCPEGMDCNPPSDPDPGDDDCDPDTDPDGCQSPTGDCDPDTDPSGCECPQALMGLSCDESAESLLGRY